MNKGFAIVALLAVGLTVVPSAADAQAKKSAKKKPVVTRAPYKGPENALVGIKLYDSALAVINTYGNPDRIEGISVGDGASAGGGGNPGGGFGGRGGGGGAGGGRSGGAEMPLANTGPMGFSDSELNQFLPPVTMNQRPPGSGREGEGAGFGPPGGPPGANGMPGGPPPGGPGGVPGGAGGARETAQFTRWTYNRNGSKYGFVIDKFNRVIQIEAIGLQNQKVRTKRGIGFGSTFGTVMKAHNTHAPDGYELQGENVTVRFLTRDRVAFRLSRLGTKKVHVVTGIVVSAGKQ